jgi:hypothetical protein
MGGLRVDGSYYSVDALDSANSGTASAGRVSPKGYYSPLRWLVFDADVSLSHAEFTSRGYEGLSVPEAVNTVISAGASVDGYHRTFGSIRWRYFGPRSLVEDDSIQSDATSLANLQLGYQPVRRLRVTMDLFNLFNVDASDIDYYFTSRLQGEPLAGVDDRHFHAAVPRTLRLAATVAF